MSPLPCQSPPTRTFPPPFLPFASIVEVSASVIVSALIVTSPPLSARLETSSLPLFVTSPPSPKSCMTPFTLASPCASMIPVLFTIPSRTLLSAAVVRITCPPSALMIPLFSTRALNAPSSMVSFTKELPFRLREILFPPASSTLPIVATMLPSLTTVLPIMAT